ncbi:MAG: hypothetical protein LBV44_05365, partial [Methylobacillus sp.]|nr:hypothetical protein [Methylobacillus sp.]
ISSCGLTNESSGGEAVRLGPLVRRLNLMQIITPTHMKFITFNWNDQAPDKRPKADGFAAA